MGRGRQKAKATKVARKLKYFSPETDYKALERELVSASSGSEPDDESDTDGCPDGLDSRARRRAEGPAGAFLRPSSTGVGYLPPSSQSSSSTAYLAASSS